MARPASSGGGGPRFMPLPGEEPGLCPPLFGRGGVTGSMDETPPASNTSDSPLLQDRASSSSASGPPRPTFGFELCSGVDLSERAPGDLNGRLQKLGPRFRVLKWAAPCVVFFFSLLFQNFGLYWATYLYVTRMDRLEASLQSAAASSGFNLSDVISYGTVGRRLLGTLQLVDVYGDRSNSLRDTDEAGGKRPLRGASAASNASSAVAHRDVNGSTAMPVGANDTRPLRGSSAAFSASSAVASRDGNGSMAMPVSANDTRPLRGSSAAFNASSAVASREGNSSTAMPVSANDTRPLRGSSAAFNTSSAVASRDGNSSKAMPVSANGTRPSRSGPSASSATRSISSRAAPVNASDTRPEAEVTEDGDNATPGEAAGGSAATTATTSSATFTTATFTTTTTSSTTKALPTWQFAFEDFEGTLEDIFLEAAGSRGTANAAVLDVLTGMVPVFFLAFALLSRDLRVWTKCCLCGSLLALLKGTLARATVVPDSAGWASCKERLGPDGLHHYLAEDPLSFQGEFLFGLTDIFRLDVLGVWLEGSQSRHPFCADMMFSGKAYFGAIFSLGLYDLARKHTASSGLIMRVLCRFLVGVGLVALMACSVHFILVNRLHYTMDVIVSLVLATLLFSNPAVAAATEFWAVDLESEQALLESTRRWGGGAAAAEHDLGELLVPPCCFPLCCFPGRYHLSALPDRQEDFSRELGRVHETYGGQLRELRGQLAEQREVMRRFEEERQRVQAQLEASLQQARQAERLKEELHRAEMDATKSSLALETTKSKELEASLVDHQRRLQEQEERIIGERQSLQSALEEETSSRKSFEERAHALAQVLVTRENERQEAAALLLGARGHRPGDVVEQAAALVAGLTSDGGSPTKAVENGNPSQGSAGDEPQRADGGEGPGEDGRHHGAPAAEEPAADEQAPCPVAAATGEGEAAGAPLQVVAAAVAAAAPLTAAPAAPVLLASSTGAPPQPDQP